MSAQHSTLDTWLHLIQAEYREMPGLRLTKPQVQRLWSLEPHLCDAVLEALIDAEILEKTHHDAYVLAGTATR